MAIIAAVSPPITIRKNKIFEIKFNMALLGLLLLIDLLLLDLGA